METSSLNSILEHPKVAVTQSEFNRIQLNLAYYQSKFDDVEYINTDGDRKRRKMQHLPIARTAAKKIASLVYNEQAEITADDDTLNDFLNDMLGNDRFNKSFERYLESCLALGGLAMRPYIDGDKVRVAFIQAPVFLPLQSNTQDVSSAAILTKTIKPESKKNVYYTLVEFHEWVTQDGQEVGGPKARSSYDDVVAAFGQPMDSTDSANPGDGVNVWVTDNGDIMAFFHNHVLTDITFRLKGGDANHKSTGSISKSDSAKSALERLGKPYAIMRSESGTSYIYKDSNGDESSFSTQGDKIFNVMSAAETKRLKGITGLDKNQ